MNCWLQVAPAVLRERRALWWQITAKRVGDGLNCFSHMVTCFLSSLPLSLCLSFLLPVFTSPLSQAETAFSHHPLWFFFLFPFQSLLFQTWQRWQRKEMEAEIDKERYHFPTFRVMTHGWCTARERACSVVFGLPNCRQGCLSCFTRLRHIALTVSDASMAAFR